MYPKVNQNIVIDIKGRDQWYRSIVAEVEEKEILISFPMDMLGLPDGTRLDITFTSDENQYKFQTEIIGSKRDKISLYRITKPQEKEIIRIQRRDNFRVNANLRAILNENELTTINLSAGGVLISCRLDIQLQEGEIVSGTLFVPTTANKEPEPIIFKGLIKRINLIGNQERKNVGIGFTNLDKRDEMKIIQYCFEKQRQMRLKERESKSFRK
jgi:c-di-GMP-binding flagellar brake protein YcgR